MPESQAPIRLILVDDHAFLRTALAVLLENEPDFEVVGEAGDGAEAVELVRADELRPDVVLMDMVMPRLNGIEAAKRITALPSAPKVLMVTAYLEDERVHQALRAGASGYLVKNGEVADLLEAVRVVHKGGTYFSPSVRELVDVDSLNLDSSVTSAYDLLTPREREVFQLLVEGLSSQAIGELLLMSPKTVDAHRAHILSKLRVTNRVGLVHYAMKRGLIEPGSDPARRA